LVTGVGDQLPGTRRQVSVMLIPSPWTLIPHFTRYGFSEIRDTLHEIRVFILSDLRRVEVQPEGLRKSWR
jgi:hypothetical protein